MQPTALASLIPAFSTTANTVDAPPLALLPHLFNHRRRRIRLRFLNLFDAADAAPSPPLCHVN